MGKTMDRMIKQATKINGVRIVFKHPRNYLHQYERDLIQIRISMGIISDTFHGKGWWIISKYNL